MYSFSNISDVPSISLHLLSVLHMSSMQDIRKWCLCEPFPICFEVSRTGKSTNIIDILSCWLVQSGL